MPSPSTAAATSAPRPIGGRAPKGAPPSTLPPEEDASTVEPPTLEGLTIRAPIGRGGFAIVWGATRDEDGAAVALKVGHADTPHTSERFKRDAEAMACVGPPYAPRVYASGRLVDGRPYIAMEELAGTTLAARIAMLSAPHDLHVAISTASSLLDALAAAHAKGIVHRDLKPDNIIFDPTGRRATLLDFGLAKSVAPTAWDITRPGTVIGTSEYMAPEQLRGEAVDERTDIYAFGVILFQLLTGRKPFEGDVASVEHGHLVLRPPRPSDLAPVPEAVEAVVLGCLAKEPARRPDSAASVKRALADAWLAARSADESYPTPSETSRAVARPAAPLRSKLLAESQRPMVVLVAEVSGAAVHVSEIVAKRNGFIARQHGARCTCVFSGTDAANPIEAAIATARELIERFGGRAALHLAALTLRPQEGGPPAVYGRAVERPDTWLPKEPYQGLVLTAELARTLPEEELAKAPAGAPFVELPGAASDAPSGPLSSAVGSAREPFAPSISATRQTPLFGHQSILEAMTASAHASFEAKSPGLVTILGDHGLGKTRLAGEAATIASRARPNAAIVFLRASPPIAGEAAPTARRLLAWILGTESAIVPDDPRALCAERIGEATCEETWPAIASMFGWPGGSVDAIDGVDVGVMRAIVEGLRRRAAEGPVAVVLDDAQWADDIALDALENAALEAEGCPLWVVMTAHPRFESVRRWGSRAERHERLEMAPLPEADAMKLAAELLLPVEYPPAAILSRLAAWGGGNPACLVDLVRALKRAGIVRRRPITGSYYVATAELEELPPQPAWQWLAVRRLDGLPPELAACVRLCAVLGGRFTREEVERVQDAIDRAGEAGTPVDVGVGLAALADLKILDRTGERWAFQSAAFQDAVYKLLEPAHRKRIHQRAFEVWRDWLEERDMHAPAGRAERTSWSAGWEQGGDVAVERTSWFDGWEHAAREAPRAWDAARAAGGGGPLRAHRKDALERIARHAGACGASTEAADAHLALAEAAMTSSRHVEADHHYTAAVSLLAEGDTRARALALSKRARARYRLYRVSDALDDLRAARAIAERLGEHGLAADTLLEESTALDHANAHAESAERVEEARPLVERLRDPALLLRYIVALGRTRWRQERVPEAIELLTRGADGARRSGDYDTRVVALLLLACALSVAGRIDEAIKRYIEVIELCMKAEDRLHLGMAYLNRVFLWLVRKSPAESIPDLRRAIQLAREVGNPWLERAATANTAEILHWGGSHDEAAVLARRSCVLAERFVERPVYEDWLLLARIQLMRGQYASARSSLGRIVSRCPASDATPTARALFRAIELVLAELGGPGTAGEVAARELASQGANDAPRWGGGGGWEDVLEDAKSSLFVEELLEILYWRTRTALHAGRVDEATAAIEQAREPLASCTGFHARFNALIHGIQTALAS